MTREQCRKLEPVLKAWTEGRAIQFRLSSGKWVDSQVDNPHFEALEWRVKPQPDERREFWVIMNIPSGVIAYTRQDDPADDPDFEVRPDYEVIHVREVL